TVVKTLVLGLWICAGVQVMMPLVEIMALVTVTPEATDTEYESTSGGASASVAVFVTVRVVSSLMVRSFCGCRIGAVLAQQTAPVMDMLSTHQPPPGLPLSEPARQRSC